MKDARRSPVRRTRPDTCSEMGSQKPSCIKASTNNCPGKHSRFSILQFLIANKGKQGTLRTRLDSVGVSTFDKPQFRICHARLISPLAPKQGVGCSLAGVTMPCCQVEGPRRILPETAACFTPGLKSRPPTMSVLR